MKNMDLIEWLMVAGLIFLLMCPLWIPPTFYYLHDWFAYWDWSKK